MGAKRGQNEGSIYWCEDRGCYRAAVLLGGRKRKYVSGKTKREVHEQVTKLLRDQQRGLPVHSNDRQTVEAYLTHWLENTAKPTVRLRTFVRYQALVRLHVTPTLGKKPLTKLGAQDLQALYSQKTQEGLAPRTVGHVHRLLHKALADAVRLSLLPRNPCDLVSPPRVPRHEITFLTPEQARQFLEAAKGDPLEALYVLALTTGMRQEEMLGLKWDCVDLEAATVQVRRTVFWLKGHGYVWSEPKSATSVRKITLTPMAVSALRYHRAKMLQARLLAGEAWEEQDIVFPNMGGGPINANNLLNRSFGPLLVKSGVPKVRFHDLRHSAASLLLTLGAHPKIVQELLGHSAISVTMDTYSHAMPTLQQEAVNRLGDLLGTGTERF